MFSLTRPIFFALILAIFFSASTPAQRRLKVYISADMEGIAGVVTADQLSPAGFEYNRFREFMTGEVLAAVSAAKEAGATEIVISDSHGNGENLLIERFPMDMTIIRSWPRPLMMMEGIDRTFNAAIFIGYHSATTNTEGVRAHTISSANLTAVTLNDKPMSEAGINAAIAGHFGVPVVMVSGDDAVVKETQGLLGPLEGAIVKRTISFHSAATLTPDAAQVLIRQKVKAALARLQDFKPYVLKTPIKLGVTFKNYRPAELLAYLPIVQRTSAHSIQFTGESIVEVSKFLEFITNYEPNLAP